MMNRFLHLLAFFALSVFGSRTAQADNTVVIKWPIDKPGMDYGLIYPKEKKEDSLWEARKS